MVYNVKTTTTVGAWHSLIDFRQGRPEQGHGLRHVPILCPRFVSFMRCVSRPLPIRSLSFSLLMCLAPGFTFCPASKLIPKAADMPSTAAGDTPAVMQAALQPSFTTKALA